jgi:hypothetical protein
MNRKSRRNTAISPAIRQINISKNTYPAPPKSVSVARLLKKKTTPNMATTISREIIVFFEFPFISMA